MYSRIFLASFVFSVSSCGLGWELVVDVDDDECELLDTEPDVLEDPVVALDDNDVVVEVVAGW